MRLENSLLNIYPFYYIILAKLGNKEEKWTNLKFLKVFNYNIYIKSIFLSIALYL